MKKVNLNKVYAPKISSVIFFRGSMSEPFSKVSLSSDEY